MDMITTYYHIYVQVSVYIDIYLTLQPVKSILLTHFCFHFAYLFIHSFCLFYLFISIALNGIHVNDYHILTTLFFTL